MYDYENRAQELARRIEALIPDHPEILTIDSPFKLFKMGLECDDLDPTLAQASAALQLARQRYLARDGRS